MRKGTMFKSELSNYKCDITGPQKELEKYFWVLGRGLKTPTEIQLSKPPSSLSEKVEKKRNDGVFIIFFHYSLIIPNLSLLKFENYFR